MSDIRAGSAALPAAVPALDGVRGLAALMVVLTHVGFQTGETARGVPGALLARADFGVALFFVLSGLLLYRPWAHADGTAGPGPSWRRYYWRRALRILPGYWLALVAVLLLAPRTGRGPGDVVANATLTQIYGSGHLLADFTQTWSLCTEVAFYVALPLTAVAVARVGRPGARLALLFALVVLNVAWTGLAAADLLPAHAGTWLPGHAGWFAFGLLLAALLEESRRRPEGRVGGLLADFAERPATLLLLAASIGALAVTPLAGPRSLSPSTAPESILKETLYGVVALLVIAAALVAAPRTPLARWLGSPPARWCGRVGYGVFLWHLLVLDAAMHVLGTPLFGGNFFRVATLTITGSLLAGWLSWSILERPLLDRFSRPVSTRRRPSLPGEPGDEQQREQRQQPGRATSRERV